MEDETLQKTTNQQILIMVNREILTRAADLVNRE